MKRLSLLPLLAAIAACSPSAPEPIASVAQELAGPVAAYGFDEGSGTTTADRSGNNLTGTLTSTTWSSAGKFGKALSFNGTSSWVTVANATALNLSPTGMTLEAWVNPSTLSSWREILYKEATSTFRYTLIANTNGNQPGAAFATSGNVEKWEIAGAKLPTGTWTHVAGTYDGHTLTLYRNGVASGSLSTTSQIGTSTGPLRIGGSSVEGEFFAGLIDEVRIYGRALSAAEIQSDMNTPINSSDAGSDASAGQDAAGDVVAEGTEANDGNVADSDRADGGDGDSGGGDGAGAVADSQDAGGLDGDMGADDVASGGDASEGAPTSDAGGSGNDGGGSVYPLRKLTGARYLVDQQGNPFLIQGDSAWSLIANTTYEDALTYLDDRRARGFNTVIVNLVEHHFSSNPPKNAYGDAPFLASGDISTPNEAYFARADAVIRAANDRGIQVLLFPLYLGDNGGNEGWWGELSSSGTAKATAYGTFVGSRYASFPGILWVAGGDYTPPDGASGKGLVEAMANAIKAADPNHLMTEHGSSWRTASLADYAGQPWLDVDAVYTRETAGAIGPDVLGQYNRADWLPTLLIESGYENELTTASELRRQSFEAILNGGMGQVWGASPVWCFSTNGTCIYSGGGTDWHASLGTASTQDQTRVWQFFSSRAWWKLAPDERQACISASSGTSVSFAADHTWCAAYLASSHAVTIGLGNFAQPVSAKWFNPSTGVFTTVAGSPFTNNGTVNSTPPTGGTDWALLVEP